MLNETMKALGDSPSVIRETFEYGNRLAAEIGRENVFDFSLGNPSVPTPQGVTDSLQRLCGNDPVALHGYTSAVGAPAVRAAVADDLNRRFQAGVEAGDIYMTCGAAASLTVTLHALCCPGDEVLVFVPFFPEYRVFIHAAGASCTAIEADVPGFQINFEALTRALNPAVKALIVNTPNNPSGAVLTDETLRRLSALLREKEAAYGHPIYLIADEPYRELVYDREPLPAMTTYYDDTVLCYSFSKSLSLPGERIGYIAVGSKAADRRALFSAVCGAGRALGFVCAPAMMQYVTAEHLGETADLSVYRENRTLLYDGLTRIGYTCVKPDGAFYLFVRAPQDDANAFCMRARDYRLLLVPSDSFGMPGYVRIAYCVRTDMIRRSLPAFEALFRAYQ